MKEKIYLYLARRDKKGMDLLSVFQGENVPRTRVEKITSLNLPVNFEAQILKTVHRKRFQWEVWIESADNFAQLREKMKQRGYRNVSTRPVPLHPVPIKTFVESPDEFRNIQPNLSELPLFKKTMLRKGG